MRKSWLLAAASAAAAPMIAVPAHAEEVTEGINDAARGAETLAGDLETTGLISSNAPEVTLTAGASVLGEQGSSSGLLPVIIGSSASVALDEGVGGGSASSNSGHGLPNYLNTAFQYAYSWDADNDFIIGYGSDSEDRHQFRFEHQQTWKYGNLYFFADRVSAPTDLGGERDFGFPCCGDGKNAEVFTVLNAGVSLSRVMNEPIKVGPFKDFGVEFRAEYSSFYDYKGVAVGLSADLDIPGFQGPGEFVRLNWWRRYNDDNFVSSPFDDGGAATTSYADHNFWGITARNDFTISGVNLEHQTFLRYQQEASGGPTELQRFNRIFMENEIFVYLTDRLSVGFRSEYFRDSGGISFGGDKSDWRPIVAIRYDIFRRPGR